jgi:hypothetical protein
MECAQENINTLKYKLSSPRFGTIPVLGEIDVKIVAQRLAIPS